MDCTDYPVDYNLFEIGYFDHPNSPYANIQFKQVNNSILLYLGGDEHLFIYDTLKNKKTQLISLYFSYRTKKNVSRTDITNDDEKAYTFAPTDGD